MKKRITAVVAGLLAVGLLAGCAGESWLTATSGGQPAGVEAPAYAGLAQTLWEETIGRGASISEGDFDAAFGRGSINAVLAEGHTIYWGNTLGTGALFVVYEEDTAAYYPVYSPYIAIREVSLGQQPGTLFLYSEGRIFGGDNAIYSTNKMLTIDYRTGEILRSERGPLWGTDYGVGTGYRRDFAPEGCYVEGQTAYFGFVRTDAEPIRQGEVSEDTAPLIHAVTQLVDDELVTVFTFAYTQAFEQAFLDSLLAIDGIDRAEAKYIEEAAFTGCQLLLWGPYSFDIYFAHEGAAYQGFYFTQA